jgi:outer membrane protein TolC
MLLPLAASAAPAPSVAGTLPEDYLPELKAILEAAQQRSPQTIAAEIEVALSEARLYAAEAPRLPSVNGLFYFASNQTAISGDQDTNNRDHGLFYSVTLNQALFHWGALKNQAAIGDINVRIAEKSYAEAYRLLTLTLRQLYLTLIAKKAALAQERYSLRVVESNFAVEEEKVTLGLVARNDLLLRDMARNEARLRVARLEADFAAERQRFARIAGMTDLTEAAVPAEIPSPAYSAANASALLAELVDGGAKNTLEAQILELRIQEAEHRYDIEKVRLRPKISAGAGSSLANATNATQNAVSQQAITQQSVSVNANWPIFDGKATTGAKLEAKAHKRQQERRLATATRETIEEAQHLVRLLTLDVDALQLTEARRDMADAAAQQAAAELSLGLMSPAAVTDAESLLLLQTANRVGARAAVLSHWSQLVSLAGLDPIVGQTSNRHARN